MSVTDDTLRRSGRSSFGLRSALAGLLILLAAGSAFAQGYRASITGKITDPSGAAVPGATVRATDTATNIEAKATSNSEGLYVITFLLPGNYRLAVEAAGFKSSVRPGITLQVNDRMTIDVALQVGEVKDSVTVTGEGPLLTPESSSMGQVITNKTIVELPLNGRNPLALQQLVSGVIPTGQSGNVNLTRPWDTNGVSDVSVSGAPNRGNMVTLNGVYAKGGNQVSFTPSIDAVEEFKVQKNSYDAEYGHAAGGTINVATKSGTNELHGALYEFLRNEKFDANSFFANRSGATKAKFHMNQFGATAGAPIYLPKVYDGRNKSFWFFNWESVRQNTPPATTSTTVPTEAQRAGDFSSLRTAAGAPILIYDPTTVAPVEGKPNTYVRSPFPNNKIPTDRQSSIARNVLGYIPTPNRPGDPTTGALNYVSTGGGVLNYDQYGTRIDHNFGEKSRIFGYVGIANYGADNLNLFNNLTTASTSFQKTRIASIDYVRSLQPDFILNARLGYSRKYEGTFAGSQGFNVASLGFPQSLVTQLPFQVFPQFSIGDATGLGSGGPSYNASDGWNGYIGFTKVKSKHTMKFGMYALVLREYDDRGASSGSSGSYSFGRNWTQSDPFTANAASGWGAASFLLGLPASGTVGVGGYQATQTTYYEWYFQDDYKVSSRLTLNLGLRWEFQGPTTDRFDRVIRSYDFGYVPTIASAAQAAYQKSPYPGLANIDVKGAPVFAGVNGQSRSYLDPEYDSWGPRIGLAYKLNQRMVLRSGFGTFFNPRLTGVDLGGFNTSTPMVTTIDSLTPASTLANPFPSGLNLVPCATRNPECLLGTGITFRNPKVKTPAVLNYSTGLQVELPGRWLLDAAYVGSTTRRFNPNWAPNALPASYLSLGNALLSAVANPFYGLIPASAGTLGSKTFPLYQLLAKNPNYPVTTNMAVAGVGHNTYHSAQFSLERRFANDFSILSSYTWSKLMAHSNYMNPGFSDAFENMVADIDRTQRLVINGIYNLPVGKGKRFAINSTILDHVIGGWQLSGVGAFQSGAPIKTNSNTVATGQSVLTSDRNVDKWFNTGAFAVQQGIAQPFGQRTLTQYLSEFRNQGIANYDISVNKSFQLAERFRLQFRSEFFNVFNRTQFASPNVSVTSATYGKVTSQANIPRQIQFGLKLVY
ncbi:MAG: carboxypeptidase regulatory-like domain-containing protein [Acidobacteria bacterium]|nr:carboxypeptidase regulatory-like domain-containing protein [Acidobacteriota bacterium]